MNKNWRFLLDEEPNLIHHNDFDDGNLRQLDVPHDWSVEFSFDGEKGEACTGFLLGGIGWYRKHFTTTQEMTKGRTVIHFDGIYNRATIYCNGERVAFHPSGYAPLLLDLTEYLKPVGEDNVIAVKVDHSRYADSRWYTGSGIYRDVWLYLLPEAHMPVWGTFITTPKVDQEIATVVSELALNNTCQEPVVFDLMAEILDPDGQIAGSYKASVDVEAGQLVHYTTETEVAEPMLWDIYDGQMYQHLVKLYRDGELVQEVRTPFGIRSFEFNPDKGFFMNGKAQLIKGVCLHHDGGLVGAAVPLDVWRRRLEILVEGGCNAIRTAHNPASEAFLNLCDEMGLLVQEEFFDEWDKPKDKQNNGEERPESVSYKTQGHAEFFRVYAQSDLQDTMLRDRNHPSIIQWSIGNEIEWTYTKYNDATGYFGIDANGFYFWTLPPYSRDQIAENVNKVPKDYYDVDTTAKILADWTKELDTTRPVTANCILPTVSYETGYCDALDLVGYSYRRVIYGYGHDHFGDKPIMGTENVPQWHEWKAVLENEHVPGIFLWTGIDHMGEAQAQGTPFPRKGSNVGILDLAGFAKPVYHMYRGLWLEEAQIHMVTQTLDKSPYQLDGQSLLIEKEEGSWQRRLWFWHEVNKHFNYVKDEPVVVEVYSNCEEVTLFHNNVDMGTLRLADFEDHIYKWVLAFDEGDLKAVGILGNEEVTYQIHTGGTPVKAVLTCDKESITIDGDSAAHVVVELLDGAGHPVTHQDIRIEFELTGPGKVLGVDNGHPDNINDFQSMSVETSEGKALMILQGCDLGTVTVSAYCKKQPIQVDPITVQVVEI